MFDGGLLIGKGDREMINRDAEVIGHVPVRRPISMLPTPVPVTPAKPTDLLSEFQDEIVWVEDYEISWDVQLGSPVWKHSPALKDALAHIATWLTLCTPEHAEALNAKFIASHHLAGAYLQERLDARWKIIARQLAEVIPQRKSEQAARMWSTVVEFAAGCGVLPPPRAKMPLDDSGEVRGESTRRWLTGDWGNETPSKGAPIQSEGLLADDRNCTDNEVTIATDHGCYLIKEDGSILPYNEWAARWAKEQAELERVAEEARADLVVLENELAEMWTQPLPDWSVRPGDSWAYDAPSNTWIKV